MSWLTNQEREVLEVALLHSPCCILVSTTSGQILWANDCFVDWIGYTLSELQTKTWMEISVQDSSLVADILEARALDGYQQSYSVQKQYIPKHSRPRWGTLHVLRYPAIGPIACCICVWEPMEKDTDPAYEVAKKAVDKMETEFAELRKLIEQAEATSLVEKAMLISIKLCITYPKTAMACFLFCVLVIGGNAALDAINNTRKLMSPLIAGGSP